MHFTFNSMDMLWCMLRCLYLYIKQLYKANLTEYFNFSIQFVLTIGQVLTSSYFLLFQVWLWLFLTSTFTKTMWLTCQIPPSVSLEARTFTKTVRKRCVTIFSAEIGALCSIWFSRSNSVRTKRLFQNTAPPLRCEI